MRETGGGPESTGWRETGIHDDADLHHVGAIEVEEDGAQRQHLVAVIGPARVHERQEGLGVRGLPEQRVQTALNVPFAFTPQSIVDRRRKVLHAHILDGAVQLLQAGGDGLLRVDRAHRCLQPLPRDLSTRSVRRW